MLQGKPLFQIEIEAKNLVYAVSVSGSAVYGEFDQKNQMSAVFPINYWVHPEKTTFMIDVAPEYGKDYLNGAFLKVTLLLKDHYDHSVNYRLPLFYFEADKLKAEEEVSQSIASGDLKLDHNSKIFPEKGEIYVGDIIKEPITGVDRGYYFSREVTIPNSLPLWLFFSCDDLPDYQLLSDEDYKAEVEDLFVEYKKIQDALAANDLASIKPMFAQRSKEMEQAFYYEQPTWTEETFEAIQAKIDDPEWTLRIRKPEDLGITFEHNRKLASLTLGGFGGSNAIGFVNSNGAYSSYPLTFCRKGGQWLLTR